MKRFLLWTMVMGIFLCSCIQQGKKQSEVKDVEEIKLTSVKYDKEQIISFPRTLALLENNLMLVLHKEMNSSNSMTSPICHLKVHGESLETVPESLYLLSMADC